MGAGRAGAAVVRWRSGRRPRGPGPSSASSCGWSGVARRSRTADPGERRQARIVARRDRPRQRLRRSRVGNFPQATATSEDNDGLITVTGAWRQTRPGQIRPRRRDASTCRGLAWLPRWLCSRPRCCHSCQSRRSSHNRVHGLIRNGIPAGTSESGGAGLNRTRSERGCAGCERGWVAWVALSTPTSRIPVWGYGYGYRAATTAVGNHVFGNHR